MYVRDRLLWVILKHMLLLLLLWVESAEHVYSLYRYFSPVWMCWKYSLLWWVLGRLSDRMCAYILYSMCIEISYVGSSMCVSLCVCCGAPGINITAVTHFCCCRSVAQLLLLSLSLTLLCCCSLLSCLCRRRCCCFFVVFRCSALHNTNTNALGRYISPFVRLIVKTTHWTATSSTSIGNQRRRASMRANEEPTQHCPMCVCMRECVCM